LVLVKVLLSTPTGRQHGIDASDTATGGAICIATAERGICIATAERGICIATAERGICIATAERGICVASAEGDICIAIAGGAKFINAVPLVIADPSAHKIL
jgi:hypothetical protein